MDFIDQLKQFSARASKLTETVQTEEATKTALIMPFFNLLGYDVFDPDEFVPEFTADVGIKKGEKVDYAIKIDGQPMILIEAKSVNENLSRHGSQLFRYFGTTKAKFGILTNGVIYRFFTDLDEPNKMDEKPFLEFNMLDIRENQIPELKKFCKSNFDVSDILDTASDLKYSSEFKAVLFKELQAPSDDFVRFFLADTYTGRQTQSVIEKFRPIVKRSLNNYISELMNDRIKSALNTNAETNQAVEPEPSEQETIEIGKENKIVTTNEELEAYFIVKSILKESVPIEQITYKDTESYLSVLYKNNSRNWICRLLLNGNKKYLVVPDENKKELRIPIENIYDIELHKEDIATVLSRYM